MWCARVRCQLIPNFSQYLSLHRRTLPSKCQNKPTNSQFRVVEIICEDLKTQYIFPPSPSLQPSWLGWSIITHQIESAIKFKNPWISPIKQGWSESLNLLASSSQVVYLKFHPCPPRPRIRASNKGSRIFHNPGWPLRIYAINPTTRCSLRA